MILGLFDPDDHRAGAAQVFAPHLAETSRLHPADAVGAGVVEPSGGFDEHAEAHQEARDILPPVAGQPGPSQ